MGIIEITINIAIDATRLPDWPYKDPVDPIIVATARSQGLKILIYRHVTSISLRKA